MVDKEELYYCDGFEWDEGNSEKNWFLHQVTRNECEEVFFNIPLIVAGDKKHSEQETRYYCLGQTDRGRFLFVAFTVRRNLIRVISARDMNAREEQKYEQQIKRYTGI